ncbi:MAG: hypothetical protein PHQ43_08725 [Dehalococcoidales bacterium]|nr:hypothetical protein [Dehalococcoidales bacterium]
MATLTEKDRQLLENQQFLVSERPVGGPRKQTYYTPDGRKIQQFPQMREFVRKDKDGHIIETGTRDANYDHGWLPAPPPAYLRQLYCPGCDKWHPDQEGVDKCIAQRRAAADAYEAKAREKAKNVPNAENGDSDRIDQMESSLAELKGMVMQLLKHLQPESQEEEG